MPYLGRSPGSGVRSRFIYAATSGQTSFSGNDSNSVSLAYEDTLYMDVYQNGVLLKPVTDYAATTGTSVVLTTGATTDDVVEMIVYDTFAVADTVSASNGGTFSGNIAVTGNVTTTGTVEPAGDTAAGDNAAIGFTSAEGLILTGQGSTSDITVKNDADGTVFTVPTGTDDILFPDSAKAMFGAASDLQISHDGSTSLIDEQGTGVLELRTNGSDIRLTGNSGSDFMVQAISNGAVNLSHDGSTKLATTSTGVDITGGFTATDGCTITTADNDPQLTLVSTDADGSRGPELLLYRNSASPANSDALGFIRWDGENDSGAQHEYIKFEGFISASSGAAAGAEQAQLDIRTMVSGDDRSRINILHDSTVFNDDSQDLDFRIDSSGYGTHNFFLQASNGYISIQSDTPEHPFDVQGNTAGPYLMRIFNDGNAANRKGLKVQCGQDSGDQVFIAFEDGDGNSVGSIQGSSGTTAYNTFTAGHPATLPPSDADEGYPYGTLVETTGITYSTDSGGNTTRGGIIYSVQKSSSANSKSVLGAYASKDNVNDGQHIIYVLGDGHILCNNAGGNIAVGDGICTSTTAGIGQKATASPSMIIGIAQEAVTFADNTETKLVAVQYGLQQFTPWS